MSTHARPLAERLAAASDAQLTELLRARGVSPGVDWDDFFDAAEALLDPASIERALAALTRRQAQALREAADGRADTAHTKDLEALALLDERGLVPAPVAAVLASRPPVPDAAHAAPRPSSAPAAARTAEESFTAIGALADLLLAALSAPLALVATGALSANEKRRLRDGGEMDDLDDLHALAEIAGLARRVDRELQVTDVGERWLAESFPARWSHVAESFRRALPRGIRSSGGWIPVDEWEWAHPWSPSWPTRARRLRALAQRVGLIAHDGSEPEWAAVLRAGAPADTQPLQELLPAEVDRLFLQNDLTAIAPGPLLPTLDNRLRAMTEHETRAQASSYRFTAESVARALVEGETRDTILAFLREVSLTGVPQPLEYLIDQTARRHGLVRVAPDGTGGAVVSSADAHLLQAIEIDRNVRRIGLLREGDTLISSIGAETVAWALADARYPATLVDLDGAPVRVRPARSAAPAEDAPASYATLIARLRAHRGPDADAAWLDRELQAAVRARSVVAVQVAMPDGATRDLILEASGIGGGRLRGRDRTADVERTLPVSSIRSVRVIES